MPSTDEVRFSRSTIPLQQMVEWSNELVKNLERATVLTEGLHDKQIAAFKQTEQGQIQVKNQERALTAVEKFVEAKGQEMQESINSDKLTVVPSDLRAFVRGIQSLAGTMIANIIKIEKYFDEHNKGAAREVPISRAQTKAHKKGATKYKKDGTPKAKPGPRPGVMKGKTKVQVSRAKPRGIALGA